MYPLFSFAMIASVAAIHILLAVVLLYSTLALSAADDTAGCRELYSAIARDDNVEIVEALIKVAPVECSLYKAIDSKWTVLSWAAEKGHTTIVDSLLKSGADPNIKNNYGNTALILAAEEGQTAIVGSLLKSGADPNIKDNSGSTALIRAAEMGRTAIVDSLLKSGADPYILDNDRKCAADYAYPGISTVGIRGNMIIYDMIVKHEHFGQTIKWSGPKILKKCPSSAGKSPCRLLEAYKDILDLRGHNFDSIDALLNDNCVDCVDTNGHTLLMQAAYDGYINIVRVLLFQGANPNALTGDGSGQTALMFACASDLASPRIQIAIVQLLLKYNAYESIKDATSMTACDYAKGNSRNSDELKRVLSNCVDDIPEL